jgi:two-component system sensor histidine kinase BaeS
MRSITVKLILSFLIVSLASVILIALLARWNTQQEFSNFVFNRNSSEMVSVLSEYYRTQGNWTGINPSIFRSAFNPAIDPGGRQPPFFTLADNTGIVLVEGPGYHLGESVPIAKLDLGLPINVDSVVVGTLLVGQNTFQSNPLENDFIQRTGKLLLFSTLVAAAMALLLGILLAYNITRPILELNRAIQSISGGTFGGQVPVRGRDELSKLASSFNKMSSDLARSTNSRRQMTADIAHELRTPLSLIIGQAEAVHDGILPPTRDNFEVIREEANRLEKLVDDLRILSLADAGELSFNLQPVSPQRMIQEIASIYLNRFQDGRITLIQEIAPDLPIISIDPGRITQVLTNIIDNALRFTLENGKIKISARQVDGFIEISISDSGPGVPEKDLERVFDRLYRIDPSRQHEDGGSGLGLSIAKSIIEMHHGQIKAFSPPGEGLTISIQLPINDIDL